MRKAVVIGIDSYATLPPLSGAVNDAIAVAGTLKYNGDGSPNFEVSQFTSNEQQVTTATVTNAVNNLFQGDAEMALLYFAGHGVVDGGGAYIASYNGGVGAWGLSLSTLLVLANNAYPHIKSSVIILDCCHSGQMGQIAGFGNGNLGVIGTGITILTASHRDQQAEERNGRGIFTSLLLDGLNGSASDIVGNITPASLYSLIDQTLGAFEQRPIYKANVHTFVTLRQVEPKIPRSVLRKLMIYFPSPTSQYKLDPSCEPDRKNVPREFKRVPVDPLKAAAFRELQLCNRHGLVEPLAEHMYYAAMNSTGCKLTALGAHYRRLAELGRI